MDFQFRNIRATIEVVLGITTKNSKECLGMVAGSTLQIAVCCGLYLWAAANSLGAPSFADIAERNYRAALIAWQTNAGSGTAAVAFAEAAFTRGEFASRDSERAEIAEKGIQAARAAAAREPTNAAAYYWMGMNIGQLARTKMLGALPLIREIAQAFVKAREIDPSVDYAGPDRSLGLLFRDAPGWPTSIGSAPKARQHLEQAVKLAPHFPENHLCLLETYDQWGERSAFQKQLKLTEQAVAAARGKFIGDSWAYTWSDWEKRLRLMQVKAAKVKGPGIL
jgi:hypothetical protein